MPTTIYHGKIEIDTQGATASVKAFTSEVSKAKAQTIDVAKQLSKLDAIQLSAIIDQVKGVSEAMHTLATPALSFEQSMADLVAITGTTGEALDELKKTAREVGAESGLGASESARAFAVLAGQIDVPIEGLKLLQKETITLAQAGALQLEDAANAVAGTINQFGLEASEASRVVNVLAAASRAGGAEVNDIAESFKVAGAAANAAGVSVEETAGALEVLAENNTKGAEAGTAMRNILIAMQATLGIDIAQTGFAGGLDIIRQKLATMGSQVERTTFLAETFGRQNIVAAQYLIDNVDAIGEMTTAVTGTNSAYEQAEIRTNTWAHKIEVARAKLDDLRISLTSATGSLLPMGALLSEQLVPLSQMIPLLSGVSGAIRGVGKALLASGIGGIAVAIATIVGALVLAYKHSEEFRQAVDSLFAELKKLGTEVLNALKPAFEAFINALKPFLPLVGKLAGLIGNILAKAIKDIMAILQPILRVVGAILEVLAKLWDAQMQIFGAIIKALLPALGKLFKQFGEGNPILDLFTTALNGIADALVWVIDKVKEAIDWFKELLGLQKEATSSVPTPQTTHGVTMEWSDEANNPSRQANPTINAIPQLTGNATGDTRQAKNRDARTIEGLQNIIGGLREQLAKATNLDEQVRLQNEISNLEEKLNELQTKIQARSDYTRQGGSQAVALDASTIKTQLQGVAEQAKKSIGKDGQITVDILSADGLQKELEGVAKWSKKVGEIRLKEQIKGWRNEIQGAQEALYGVVGTMSSLGDVVGGNAGKWLQWGANVVSAIAQALPKLLALFNANVATAAAEGATAQASIPIVGPLMAVASVASILGALSNIPKATAFADGGIVYGATYALTGEYPGASNNPEVIAPLNKLKSLLEPTYATNGFGGGEVNFRIRGRELVGILNKENKTRKLS